jgi:hypothetical protein
LHEIPQRLGIGCVDILNLERDQEIVIRPVGRVTGARSPDCTLPRSSSRTNGPS